MHHAHKLLLAVILFASLSVHAHKTSYTPPADTNLETAEACRTHNADFLKAADYLIATPLDAPDRKQANSFAVTWMSNTPDVSINLYENMLDAVQDPEMMSLHMIGYSRYMLEAQDKSELGGNLAGHRTVISYYKNPTNKVRRNSRLDRYVKLEEKGQLEAELALMMKKKMG